MKAQRSPAMLSPIDSQRWKAVTAKAYGITAQSLPAAMAFCRQHRVELFIARCASDDLRAAQAMEQAGFQIMDTLVYYSRDLPRNDPDDGAPVNVRELRAGEDVAVRQVAAKCFSGYLGHYHADPRLSRRQCDEAYQDWAQRSCTSKELADVVLVAAVDGAIAGFVTVRLNSAEEGEVALFAVAPEFQGRGIGRGLMAGAMRWCRRQGRARLMVSTQITNLAAQRVWTKLGFEPFKSLYTFHKWF